MRQFFIIISLVLMLTLIGALGFHTLTEITWLEACYLAVITLTTVGSRDVGDRPGAMIFVMVYLVCGLGIFTYSAFQLGQILVNADFRRMLKRRRMERELNKLKDHYIVCGAGRMGTSICEYLAGRRQAFVAIDRSKNVLDALCVPHKWHYVHGDATDDDVLKQAGIERARALATVLADDADNVYVVLSARLLSSKLQIVARASDVSAVQKLQRAGATRVISAINSGAVKIARFMLNPRIEDFLEIADEWGQELELVEVQIESQSRYAGQSLSQTDLRQKGIMVVGIRRTSGQHIVAPDESVIVQPGDSLIAFGSARAVDEMVAVPESE